MKSKTSIQSAMLGAALLLSTQVQALGGATRTWVSGVGDDANPCSRTAPCKTWAGAISKTADGGEIDALDPGGFGAVTITRPMTLDGAGTMASILNSGTNGVTVNLATPGAVTLRHLSINGAGTGLSGVRFIGTGTLNVEACDIFGNTKFGIEFAPAVDGTARLNVLNTVVHDNPTQINGGGILVKPASAGAFAKAYLDHVQSNNNLFGVRVEDRGNVVVTNSEASHNFNNGFVAMGTTASAVLSISNSSANYNGNSGIKASGANALVRMNGSTLLENSFGYTADTGGVVVSFGNNAVAGGGANASAVSVPLQ